MSTAFERRVKRLREHVLNQNKQEKESIGEVKALEELKVEELKDLAKEKGIKGYSTMKREELIEVLKEEEDEE